MFFLKQDLKTEGFPKINIKSEVKLLLLEKNQNTTTKMQQVLQSVDFTTSKFGLSSHIG